MMNLVGVAGAWLDAVNSGDIDRLRGYQDTYAPDDPAAIDWMRTLRHWTGGLDLLRVEAEAPTHIEALLKGRGGDCFARLILDLDTGDRTSVRAGIRTVPRPADQPAPRRLSFADTIEALDTRAMQSAAEDRFAGALLVAREGRIVFRSAYGLADRENRTPNMPDTRFRIGSMNKMFTATAVLQLVGQGRIDLDSPLGRYLADYPNQELASTVTVRHLLTHTGGTGDIFTPEYFERRLNVREPRDYLDLYGSRELEFEPGSRFSYSNYGFILLGVIIESTAVRSYYDYVREHIFLPASMQDTDSLPEEDNIPHLSTGYVGPDWVSNRDTLPWRGTPAGGGYSTVGDLFRFAEALSKGQLVEDRLLAAMTRVQASAEGEPPGTGYGFGMRILQDGGFGHSGGAPGMNGALLVFPASDTVVAALANVDPPLADWMIEFFQDRMPIPAE